MAIHHLDKMYVEVTTQFTPDRNQDASPLLSTAKAKPLTAFRLRPAGEGPEHDNAFRPGFSIENLIQNKLILASPEGHQYMMDIQESWMSVKYFLKMDMQNVPCAMLYDDVVRRTFLGTEAQYKNYVSKLKRATEDLKKNGPKVGTVYQSYLGEPGPLQDVILIRYLGTFNNEAAWVKVYNNHEHIGPYFSTDEHPDIIARMIPMVAGEMRFIRDVRSPTNMSLTIDSYRKARAPKKGVVLQAPLTPELWSEMMATSWFSLEVGNLKFTCRLKPKGTSSSRKTNVLVAVLIIQPLHMQQLPELVELLTKLGVARSTIESAVSTVAPRCTLTADNRLTYDPELTADGPDTKIYIEFQENGAYDKPGRAFELLKDAKVTVYDYFGKYLVKELRNIF